jgi:hypothetical protein
VLEVERAVVLERVLPLPLALRRSERVLEPERPGEPALAAADVAGPWELDEPEAALAAAAMPLLECAPVAGGLAALKAVAGAVA